MNSSFGLEDQAASVGTARLQLWPSRASIIPSRFQQPTMKILGVGLSKTGTSSLHRALGVLHYRSLHYDEKRLNDILDGSSPTPNFRRYDDVDAVLDIPTACFYEELLEVYPDCKCILTVRSERDWWKSIEAHFARGPVLKPEDNPFKWRLRNYVYGSSTAVEYLFRKRYREHNEHVLRKIPSSQLLVMDITKGDGWRQLCPFLAVDESNQPFPHQNSRIEGSFEYWEMTHREILKIVDIGNSFILIDPSHVTNETFQERTAYPFLERDGQFWGAPENDDTAIRELERMQRYDPSHIIFTWSAFWWLDEYSGFLNFLRSRYDCVHNNDRLIAFDLRHQRVVK